MQQGEEEQGKDECFNGGNAILRINHSAERTSDSICLAVISFTDSLSSTTQTIRTFPRPYCMRHVKPAERGKMGTELCCVFTGAVEDHTAGLLPELAESGISALRIIQRSLSKRG